MGNAKRKVRKTLIRRLRSQLKGPRKELVKAELRKFLKQKPCWLPPASQNIVSVIEIEPITHIDHVDLPAHPLALNVGREFKVRSDLKIVQVSSHFLKNFSGTIPQVGPRTVHCYRLNNVMNDNDIIMQMGGQSKVAVDMQTIFQLIQRQKLGLSKLLTDQFNVSNLFYVPNNQRELMIVYYSWIGDGWQIGCSELNTGDHMGDRRIGQQVITGVPRVLSVRP